MRGPVVGGRPATLSQYPWATSVKPLDYAPGKDCACDRHAANGVAGQALWADVGIDQVADEVKHDFRVIAGRRASGAGFPIHYVDCPAIDQEVLGLDVPVEIDRWLLVQRGECGPQILPPGVPTAAGARVVPVAGDGGRYWWCPCRLDASPNRE